MKQTILFLSLVFFLQAGIARKSLDPVNQMIETREKVALMGHGSSTQNYFFIKHSLVFFFASTCPHCHDQAPVLAEWASDHQAKVLAFSFDDRSLPEFQDASPVTTDLVDVAFAGQPIRYPALFVMENATHTLYPVAFGALSQDELNERMTQLLPKIQMFEQKASL